MGRGISQDLRDRVVAAIDGGMALPHAAARTISLPRPVFGDRSKGRGSQDPRPFFLKASVSLGGGIDGRPEPPSSRR